MKKIALIIIVIVIRFNIGFSADTANLRLYYDKVHRAGVQTCKSNLEQANIIFDSAFALIPSPFFVDIVNALYCKIHSGSKDTAGIICYFKMIQKKGLCVHEEFKKVIQYAPYLELLDEKECKKVIDINMSKKVEHAIAEDQKMRLYSLKKFKETYHPSILPEIRKIDSINYYTVIDILQLAEKKDKPLEDLIGKSNEYKLFTILLHSVPWGRYNNALLERLVKKGILESRYTTYQIDGHCGGTYNGKSYSDYDSVTNCKKVKIYGNNIFIATDKPILIIPPPNMEALNKRRANMYLSDAIEEAKIRAYYHFNVNNGLPSSGFVIVSGGADFIDEMESRLGKNNCIRYDSKEDFDFDRKY